MNRRAFLTAFGKAAVATALVTGLPIGWIPAEPRRYAAIDFLVKAWRDYMKGRSSRECPDVMFAGQDLFDGYYHEVLANMRYLNNGMAGPFTDTRDPRENLMFKAGRLINTKKPGWWVRFSEESEFNA